jgi:hypothetical protein
MKAPSLPPHLRLPTSPAAAAISRTDSRWGNASIAAAAYAVVELGGPRFHPLIGARTGIRLRKPLFSGLSGGSSAQDSGKLYCLNPPATSMGILPRKLGRPQCRSCGPHRAQTPGGE